MKIKNSLKKNNDVALKSAMTKSLVDVLNPGQTTITTSKYSDPNPKTEVRDTAINSNASLDPNQPEI